MAEPISQPVQTINKQHGAKTLFWYFSLFWTMGVTAFATGTVWFQVINKFLPKEISYAVNPVFNQYAIKGAIAALIVGAPAFFLFAWLIRRAIDRDEIQLKKGARQWVGYLILFIVVATALGDIITTVLTWLNGDFTIRFLLKGLTILLITGWIFTYFWLSLRSEDGLKNSPFPKIAVITSILLIVVSLVTGFTLVDTPTVTRAKAYDQQRTMDLENLSLTIDNYYLRFKELPVNLGDLEEIQNVPVDPRTNQPYTYQVVSKNEYKLCAVFEMDNKTLGDNSGSPQMVYPGGYQPFWHTVGENCFSLIAAEKDQLQKTIPIPVEN